MKKSDYIESVEDYALRHKDTVAILDGKFVVEIEAFRRHQGSMCAKVNTIQRGAKLPDDLIDGGYATIRRLDFSYPPLGYVNLKTSAVLVKRQKSNGGKYKISLYREALIVSDPSAYEKAEIMLDPIDRISNNIVVELFNKNNIVGVDESIQLIKSHKKLSVAISKEFALVTKKTGIALYHYGKLVGWLDTGTDTVILTSETRCLYESLIELGLKVVVDEAATDKISKPKPVYYVEEEPVEPVAEAALPEEVVDDVDNGPEQDVPNIPNGPWLNGHVIFNNAVPPAIRADALEHLRDAAIINLRGEG